jgi:hypothetical protein
VTRALLVLTLLAILAGCATSPPPQRYPRADSSPRARCMADPNETGLRPLVFLFCVESP